MKIQENKTTIFKLSFYCISLWILMLMLIVLKFDCSTFGASFNILVFLKNNVFSIICIGFIVVGVIGYIIFLDTLKNAKELPINVEKCQSANYENLSFLATYIIPLACFPMDSDREKFVLFAIIVIIGCIFVKTDLYYTNPSLVLLGFNIYSIEFIKDKKIKNAIVIVRGKLKEHDVIKYLILSENVYFARRIK